MGAWDIVKIVMQILGGMGTFLVGMKILSENMTRLAHGKLRSMLASLPPRKHGLSVGFPRLRTLRHRHSQARRRWHRQRSPRS